jgi:hypothetical protein
VLQAELDRRLQAAQTTDPLKRREDLLRRDQARLTKSMERLLTGYQENLITLEELRCRMPELRKQQRAIEAELQSLEMTAVDPTRNLRLVENPRRVPYTIARQRRRPGSDRASESRTATGAGGPRRGGRHHNPPFNSHAGSFARLPAFAFRWGCRPGIARREQLRACEAARQNAQY